MRRCAVLRVLFVRGNIVETQKLVFGQPAPKPEPAPYSGPFPRGKHSHRCQKCGQATYCYKTGCKLPQKIQKCRWC